MAVTNFAVPIAYLREIGVVSPEVESQSDPVSQILEQYRSNLITERGLTESSTAVNLHVAKSFFLLGRAPDPARAGHLTRSQVMSALRAAGRHHVQDKAESLRNLLRTSQLRQPATIEAAYATIVSAQVKILTAINEQIAQFQVAVSEHFGRHPAAEIYLSQPGLGPVLAARVLGEFGDNTTRFSNSRARKNYSGQSPITRASGKRILVMARYATNRRSGNALHQQAFSAISRSPGARAYYDTIRGRGIGHHAALRQLANRLVGVLHGCLKTGTPYDEATAWPHRVGDAESSIITAAA